MITMIETHAFNAWLDADLRSSSWFPYLNLLNGFVAPSFLFIAGVSFAFVAESRWGMITAWSPALRKTLRRLAVILALGYWLHIPRLEWHGILPMPVESDLAEFFRVDVLHTIAVSLIFLHLCAIILGRKSVFLVVTVILAVVAVVVTPYLWSVDFHQHVHPAISNYLNGRHNPLFPLFPWSVFLWSGALVGFWYLDSLTNARENQRVLWIALAGIGIFVLSFLADLSPIRVFEYESFWLTSPNWVLMRLGLLLVIFCGFWFLEQRGWHTSALVRRFGSQSLFAYVVHLMIIYSITGEKAGFPILDQDHDFLSIILLFLSLLVLMYFLTVGWTFVKREFFQKMKRPDKKESGTMN